MSLSDTHHIIEQALKDSGRFSQVSTWAGDVQSLIEAPKQIPAAFVLLSGVDYDAPIALRQPAPLADNLWSVIVFEYVTTQPGTTTIAAYQAIEATVAAVSNLKVSSNRRLWPVQARLLGSVKNSVSSYGIQFSLI